MAVPHKAFQGDMSEAPLRPVLRLPLTHLPHQPRQYLHSAPSRHSCLVSPPGLGEYLLLFGCFRDQLFSWKTPKLAVDLPSAQSLGSLTLPPHIFHALSAQPCSSALITPPSCNITQLSKLLTCCYLAENTRNGY